jgi:hypothetical protein
MCGGGGGSAPPPPPKVPEAPRLPEGEAETTAGVDARRRRAAAGQTRGGTILTSASGVQGNGAAATNTLLGQ